jgi:hypothetical protein
MPDAYAIKKLPSLGQQSGVHLKNFLSHSLNYYK